MRNDFPGIEAIKYGWQTAKKNLLFFLPILLVILVINFVTTGLDRSIPKDATFFRILMSLVGWIIGAGVSVGLIKIALAFVDGRKPTYAEFSPNSSLILNFLISSVVFGLIVGFGIILLIIPGIIFSLKLQFFPYFLIDKQLGPIEALKQSWKMTKGIKMSLLIYGALITLINIGGALLLFIGLVWTIPATQISTAYLYRKLATRS